MNNNENVVNNNQVGSLTINRENSFVGMASKFKIYVDGVFVGTVKNGCSITFPIYYGVHRIEIKQLFNYGMKDIVINDMQNNVVLNCHIKMGVFANSIEIN